MPPPLLPLPALAVPPALLGHAVDDEREDRGREPRPRQPGPAPDAKRHARGVRQQEEAHHHGEDDVADVDDVPRGEVLEHHRGPGLGVAGEQPEAEVRGHDEQEEHGEGHGQQHADLPAGPEVEPARETRPVVPAGQPAPGGHHQLARLGLARAGLRALAAVVAEPGFRRLEEPLLEAELEVPDDAAGKGVLPVREAAHRRAVPAVEAAVEGRPAEARQLLAEAVVHAVGRRRRHRLSPS